MKKVPKPKKPITATPADAPEKTREQIAAEGIEAKLQTIKEEFGFTIDSRRGPTPCLTRRILQPPR